MDKTIVCVYKYYLLPGTGIAINNWEWREALGFILEYE